METLLRVREEIEQYLDRCLPQTSSEHCRVLVETMRYSTLGGGKRLRGVLALGACRALNGRDANVLPTAAALEMIHTYSLVHDDLPAMDDDDYRRGKLATHKKYGEAMGILTGDALLTHAFYLIARETEDKAVVAPLVEALSWYSGVGGMVAGQVADILSENQAGSADLLDFIHHHKTGALIMVACRCGAIAAGAGQQQIEQLSRYGKNIGLAFQIVDDLLDVTGTEDKMGKQVGKDSQKGKLTYPGVWGVEKSREMSEELIRKAHEALVDVPDNRFLLDLADFIAARDY